MIFPFLYPTECFLYIWYTLNRVQRNLGRKVGLLDFSWHTLIQFVATENPKCLRACGWLRGLAVVWIKMLD